MLFTCPPLKFSSVEESSSQSLNPENGLFAEEQGDCCLVRTRHRWAPGPQKTEGVEYADFYRNYDSVKDFEEAPLRVQSDFGV